MNRDISKLQKFYEDEQKKYRKFKYLDTLLISTYHMLSENTENIIKDASELLTMYNNSGIYKANISEHDALIISSMISTEKEIEEFIDKSRTFSELLNESKMNIRGNELTVLSEKSAKQLASDKIESRKILEKHPFFKPGLIIKNQSVWLNTFFALGEDSPEMKCKKFFDTVDLLNQNGYSFNKKNVEECFGLFSIVDIELEALVGCFIEIDEYLKESGKIDKESDRLKYSTILAVNLSIYSSGKDIRFNNSPIDDVVIIARYLEEWVNSLTFPPSAKNDGYELSAACWANV